MNTDPRADLRVPKWARPLSAALALTALIVGARAIYDGRLSLIEPVLALAGAALLIGWIWVFGNVALRGQFPAWFTSVYVRLNQGKRN